jgi:tetratricopeptide (TPR) repeat protein
MKVYRRDEMIGQQYLVSQPPLRGGMGIVYLCYDTENGLPVALKTFQQGFSGAAALELFRQEALIWVALERHLNVVRCWWVKEFDHQVFILMDLVTGPAGLNADLGSWIRHGRLNLETTLDFAIQICRGLRHARKKIPGMIHRDLKPGNILVTSDKVAKVTDFGLAKAVQVAGLVQELDKSGVNSLNNAGHSLLSVSEGIVGTPPYMPPEQWQAAPLDVRADVYSFGCMLYEMLTGRWVFQVALTPHDLKQKEQWLRAWQEQHESSPVPALPSVIPNSVAEIVKVCLAKDREARFANFDEVEEALGKSFREVTGRGLSAPESAMSSTEEEASDLYNKGISLRTLDRLEEAKAAYEQSIKLHPTAHAWANLSDALINLGRQQEALRAADQALALDSADHIAWGNKARAMLSLGHTEEALEALDSSLDSKATQAETWFVKGGILYSANRFEEALTAYETGLKLDPIDSHAWTNKGAILAALGRAEESLAAYNRAIALAPGESFAWVGKGASLGDMNRWEESLSAIDRALSLDGGSALAWNNKGNGLHHMGHCTEALEAYDHALRLNPSLVGAWINKATCLADAGRYDEALAACENLLSIAPDHASAWYSASTVLSKQGRLDEALAAVERSLELDPESLPALNHKGLTLDRLGQWREAVEVFNTALGLDPENALAWSNMAAILADLGQAEQAMTAYEQALKFNPSLANAWSGKGAILVQWGRLEEGLEALNRALSLEPNLGLVYSNRGATYRRLQRFDEAMADFERAIQLEPTAAQPYYNLAVLLYDRGSLSDALRYSEKAGQLGLPQGMHFAAQIREQLEKP